MLRIHRRRAYDLDQPIRESDLDPTEPACASDFFRHTLKVLLIDAFDGVHWFYHEVNDCVRCCLWRADGGERGVWSEQCPMGGSAGRRLLCELRAHTHVRRREQGRIWGALHYRWQGALRSFDVDSPHEWDVRLFRSERRPAGLPFDLVFAGPRPWEGNPETQ